jgi:Zn-dependent peptidase ImmA (M78 family)
MGKRTYAKVKAEILSWARESAGFSISEAALALKMEESALHSWEKSLTSPTVAQLRKLATLYKRPLGVFYLQQVPKDFQVISDFRRPSEYTSGFSPQLTYEIRTAHQRRELAIELLNEAGEKVNKFGLSLDQHMETSVAGQKLRKFLGIADAERAHFATDAPGRKAWNRWREAIEGTGVLVFQSTKIPSEEASGFALAYSTFPVAVVNRKDAPVRRLFSLVHELAHIALGQSGVSDLQINELMRAPSGANVEVFCNRVAAEALMPKELLLNENIIRQHGQSLEWDEQDIKQLARSYGVSREAMLVRLLNFRLTNQVFLEKKQAEYRAEYERKKLVDLAKPSKDIPRDMPQETISNFGQSFVRLVLGNYHQDRLTLSEVSGYLGLKTRHVQTLEDKLKVAA